MRCHLHTEEPGKLCTPEVEVIEAEPECGHDFCEACEECLACQCTCDGPGSWHKYVDRADYERWKASGSADDLETMLWPSGLAD